MEEYNKLPNHPYLSKEQKEKIREKFIKMTYHEKVNYIDWLYKLIENPEEAMEENDYIVDVIVTGAGLAVATIQWGVAALNFVVAIGKYAG